MYLSRQELAVKNGMANLISDDKSIEAMKSLERKSRVYDDL